MGPDEIIDLGQQALRVLVIVAAPVLLSALIVGLLIGMIQAATQINEATLSFVPKLFVLAAALAIFGPWMLQKVVNFTRDLITNIPHLVA